jgi:hypothetical protein
MTAILEEWLSRVTNIQKTASTVLSHLPQDPFRGKQTMSLRGKSGEKQGRQKDH